MQITQEELERRLSKSIRLEGKLGLGTPGTPGTPKNLETPEKISDKTDKTDKSNLPHKGNDENNRNNAGRKSEVPNAPKSLRIVSGILANAEGNAARVARNLELTPGQVLYASGQEQKLTEKKVQEVALTRLMDALGLLTPISMINEKPKDISSIAANLSRVHSNLRDRNGETGNQLNVTIYAPSQRKLSDYDSIEVKTGT